MKYSFDHSEIYLIRLQIKSYIDLGTSGLPGSQKKLSRNRKLKLMSFDPKFNFESIDIGFEAVAHPVEEISLLPDLKKLQI